MFRVNPDGSILVGMLPEEKPVEAKPEETATTEKEAAPKRKRSTKKAE